MTELPLSAVPDFRGAGDRHLIGGETDLRGKGAAAALLAIEAMADRDARRVAGGDDGELAAAAGGGVGGHLANPSACSTSRIECVPVFSIPSAIIGSSSLS